MKKLLVLPAMLIGLMATAQTKTFTMTGKIGSLNKPAMVYLDYMDNGEGHADSALLVDGQFKFTGKIKTNAYARMAMDHTGDGKGKAVYTGDAIYFYFGPEQIQIASKDSLANAVFTGSKIYDEHMAYNKTIGGSIMELTKAVNAEFASGSPEDQKDPGFTKAVNDRYMAKLNNKNEQQLLFAEANPNSFFSLVALSETQKTKENEARIVAAFKKLNPQLKGLDMGVELAQRIDASTLTAIGASAPVFTQNDVNGKPVSLAGLKGKVVLVEFWASWCGPCRAENPNLVKLYNQYKDKGFEILAVSLDSDKASWQKAIKADGLPWLHVSDLKGWNNAVGRMYGVRGVPASVLVDKDGKVIGNELRGESLKAKLAELYK
jgi:thiol-disulfide isomerase/thioredoxin